MASLRHKRPSGTEFDLETSTDTGLILLIVILLAFLALGGAAVYMFAPDVVTALAARLADPLP